MKRALAILMACGLLFAATACGGTEKTTDYRLYPQKTMKTDGQLYTGGEVSFPDALWQTPEAEHYDALDRDAWGIKGYFIDSVQDTKVFAFVGIPETATAENPVPGIVLIHGGGGTAFVEWVNFWVSRGYAAIAMDTDGNMPTETSLMSNNDHTVSIRAHGPANYGFADWQKEIEQQWAYHAIASVIVCNSFLRSFDEVDGSRIGVTGISYGSFLTCQAAAYDDRFCFAAPVYGSLDQQLGDTSFSTIMTGRKAELWDNNIILMDNQTPFLYLNSNIDQFFSVVATSASDEITEYSQMSLKYGFLHSHELGALHVPEIYAFADNICLETEGLLQMTEQPTAEKQSAKIASRGAEVKLVTGYYTTAEKLTHYPVWLPVDGTFSGDEAEVSIPGNAKYFYINVLDDRGLEISSRVIACNP